MCVCVCGFVCLYLDLSVKINVGLCAFSPADGGLDHHLPLTASTVMCKYEQKPTQSPEYVGDVFFFLQTTDMLKLNISLCRNFVFL